MCKKETQKYLKESCYHRIKCTTTTFLAAFMWRRPLNNAASANATHRKLKRVFDGTGTQVKTQMINKCRIKLVQIRLYNVKDLPWKRKKNCKQIYNRALRVKYLRISVLKPIREHYSLTNFCYLSLLSIKTFFFCYLIHVSPVLQPILYKFIVLGCFELKSIYPLG